MKEATSEVPTVPTTASTLPAKREGAELDGSSSKQVCLDTEVKDVPKLEVMCINEHAKLPKRGSPLSAGYDLSAAEEKTIEVGGRAVVQTGLKMKIPEGCYGRVAPRSGLAVRNGINTGAGVIDADYRGEVGVVLFNHGTTDFKVNIGDRIAQLILEHICLAEVEKVDQLDDTQRGEGGFGSTGVTENK